MSFIYFVKNMFCCGDTVQKEIKFIENDKSDAKIKLDPDLLVAEKSQRINDFNQRYEEVLSTTDIFALTEDEIEEVYRKNLFLEDTEGWLPPVHDSKPTLVLDLDNTLIYSTTKEVKDFDHEITINCNGKTQKAWIIERPFLKNFLSHASKKYDIVLFTAGIRQYAIKVMKKIDTEKRISYLLDRRFCTLISKSGKNQEFFTKDLRILGRDLLKTLIVDDKEYSFCFDYNNGILVPIFNGDREDQCLKALQIYLDYCYNLDDMRVRQPFTYK
ncbi:hypothetical protein GINT2_000179 [Glugoides intestinalis]